MPHAEGFQEVLDSKMIASENVVLVEVPNSTVSANMATELPLCPTRLANLQCRNQRLKKVLESANKNLPWDILDKSARQSSLIVS